MEISESQFELMKKTFNRETGKNWLSVDTAKDLSNFNDLVEEGLAKKDNTPDERTIFKLTNAGKTVVKWK